MSEDQTFWHKRISVCIKAYLVFLYISHKIFVRTTSYPKLMFLCPVATSREEEFHAHEREVQYEASDNVCRICQ